MRIIPGKKAANSKETTLLAFREAGVEDASIDFPDMFQSLNGADKLRDEADRIIGHTIKNRYGNKVTWRAEQRFVSVPRLQYESKDIPQLIIEITTYLVAEVAVRTSEDHFWITVVGPAGKPETLSIPMIFLHALLEKDLGRFAILGRDSLCTTWEVPEAKPVRLPNDFISKLIETLKWMPAVAWLEEFGSQGRCLAPLVAGTLLGLSFQDASQRITVNQEMFTTDSLVSALESLAYQPAEAREMVKHIAPRIRADMTLEEAIRMTLHMREGGNKS